MHCVGTTALREEWPVLEPAHAGGVLTELLTVFVLA